MNKVAVLTYRDGTQGLKTLKEIMSIGKEYKQEWRKLKALASWCFMQGIKRVDVYRMDGTFDGWIIQENGRNF